MKLKVSMFNHTLKLKLNFNKKYEQKNMFDRWNLTFIYFSAKIRVGYKRSINITMMEAKKFKILIMVVFLLNHDFIKNN